MHHSIVAFDIEGFGRLDRNDPIRGALRTRFFETLREGLLRAGIDKPEYWLSDTGDGALVLLKPHVSKRRLLAPLLSWLATELAAHGAGAAEREALRLRAVVHAGEVTHDQNGVYGEDLNHAFRLLDAPDLREWLARTDAPLAAIVSGTIYDGIVKHGYSGIDPEAFVRVAVTVKETRHTPAWIWIPDVAQATPAPSVQPSAREEIANVLAPNRGFTGRDAELAGIRRMLTAPSARRATLALHGLAGVGKSQLAREYAHRYGANYEVRWWIRAERPATILAGLAELARRLGVPNQGQRAQLAAGLVAELARRDRWLLIFDNAERPEDLARYLPAGMHGHILITTRYRDFSLIATPLKVEELSKEGAWQFLRRRTGCDDADAATELAAALGHLPLALEQAAAYINKAGLTIHRYLELYRRHREELLCMGRDTSYEHASVEATFRLAFERIKGQAPAAAQLAMLCSFLAPVAVPDDLVRSMPELLPAPLSDAMSHEPTYLEKARGALVVHSLAEADQHGLYMHHLVQAVIRRHLPRSAQKVWAECAVRLLDKAWPADPHEPEAWPLCRQLLHHVIVATELAEQLDVAPEATARLLRAVGVYHIDQAEPVTTGTDPMLAKAELERALAILEATCRPDDPEIGLTLTHLSRALRRLEQPLEARATLERAVQIYEAADGTHPGLAAVFTYLGASLCDLGDHAGARITLERALGLHEATHGPDSREVAWTLINLGRVLRRLGDHAGARTTLERALAIVEAVHGACDYRVAQVLTHLGRVLRRLGDYDAAWTSLERALSINETVFGPAHHRTAEALIHIGALLRDQGNLTQARARLERALAINHGVYGAEHYLTARTRTHLGRVLRRLEDLPRARTTLERALRDTERARGDDHPQVAWSLVHLSTVLQAQGHLDQARTALERALAIVERTYATDHPDIAWILTHLSAVTILDDPRRQVAAAAALERALAITEDAYGKDHLDVAWTLTHVGGALQRVGQLTEARTLLQRALAITEETAAAYGRPHSQIVPTLIALGLTLQSLEDTAGAFANLKRAYTIASDRFGPDHPETRAAWDAYRKLIVVS